MRVAALYDIHGNLPALETVLGDVARAEVDLVVVGGDVVCGPMTRDVLACLADLVIPVRCIRGNAEAAVLAEMAGAPQPHPLPASAHEVVRWEAAQLRDSRSVIEGWPATIRLAVPGIGQVLFCHATPRDDNEVFLASTPEDALLPIFGSLDAGLVVCGHTHMPFDRTIGDVRVVNAGSVGMPFGIPGADWLLLDPEVEPRHTDYDRHEAARRIRASAYPQAEEYASSSVLTPPSAAAMTEALSRVALR